MDIVSAGHGYDIVRFLPCKVDQSSSLPCRRVLLRQHAAALHRRSRVIQQELVGNISVNEYTQCYK